MGLILRLALVALAIYLLGRLFRRLVLRPVATGSMPSAAPAAALLAAAEAPVRHIRGRRRLIVTACLALLFTLLIPWGDGAAFKLQLAAAPVVMLPWVYPVVRARQGRPMQRWLALSCCAVALLWALFMLVLGLTTAYSEPDPSLLVASLPTLACALALLYCVRLYTRHQAG